MRQEVSLSAFTPSQPEAESVAAALRVSQRTASNRTTFLPARAPIQYALVSPRLASLEVVAQVRQGIDPDHI